MKTAIITGANGFIGSHVAHSLLKQGWYVQALGRSKGANSWADRVASALSGLGGTRDRPEELSACDVDLNAADLAAKVPRTPSAAASTTLFHVAGDTRFTPGDPSLQRTVNVEVTRNVVTTLRDRIGNVIHVSTAYVAGDRTGLIREQELEAGQGFRHPYEKSKYDAELAVTEICATHGIALTIVRPSIITNDRVSGQASTFTHLNALVEVLSRVQEHYGIPDGQVVNKVVRLLGDAEARPNLAPIDSIIPPLLHIAQSDAARSRVFHLCHPNPQTNLEIVHLVRSGFQVSDKIDLQFVSELPRPMTYTEELIARSLKVYAPYMNSRCEFDLSNCRAVVPGYDSFFSQLDEPYIQKVIAWQRHTRRQG